MLATVAVLATLFASQQTDTQVAVHQGIRLDVTNLGGSIVVKTWMQNAVRVHAEHSDRLAIQVVLDAAALTINAPTQHETSQDVDYTITAPRWMALNLSGIHTDVEVDGTEAPVTVETVNGDVKCRGGSGYISLQSVSGSIGLQEAKGRIEVHSVSDDITLADVSGDIVGETVSGDVRFEGVESGNVDISSVSGEVLYDGTIADNGHYHFSTHNGDVVIVIPDKANAVLSVSTFNGDFDSSFPVSVTETKRHRFSFTIGSGSARVDLSTFNGDIRLRRPGHVHDHEDHEHDHDHDHDESH
jgi:DUF4097 and DUF4098 domain-containing protein YvlB